MDLQSWFSVSSIVAALLMILLHGTVANANQNVHRRRRLDSKDSIGEYVRNEHMKGNKHPAFTLTATTIPSDPGLDSSGGSGGSGGGGGKPFQVDVMETRAAVTPQTTMSFDGGAARPVGDTGYSILVTNYHDGMNSGTMAIIVVDRNTNDVRGIVQSNGERPIQISQKPGEEAFATEAEQVRPPSDWACEVSDHHRHGIFDGRSLEAESHGHHDHDRNGEHDRVDLEFMMESVLHNSLRGSDVHLEQRRQLPQQTSTYTYQVDMYIEIDQDLIIQNNNDTNLAIQYVNSLLTAANTIYEREIDTHLNVVHIDINSNYDGATSASDALSKMYKIYSGISWHWPGADLHHAFLGKDLGGGAANVGVLCDSVNGFGVTSSMDGNFTGMDSSVVWDLYAVMHEVGHSFGSGHTHSYVPRVDSCGVSCPVGIPSSSSTLMSYCYMCSGSFSNIMYTFGGQYSGIGPRKNIVNWVNNLLLNSTAEFSSYEPRRVPSKMFDHVSSRTGKCLSVPRT